MRQVVLILATGHGLVASVHAVDSTKEPLAPLPEAPAPGSMPSAGCSATNDTTTTKR
jgi:hypothetical protein